MPSTSVLVASLPRTQRVDGPCDDHQQGDQSFVKSGFHFSITNKERKTTAELAEIEKCTITTIRQLTVRARRIYATRTTQHGARGRADTKWDPHVDLF